MNAVKTSQSTKTVTGLVKLNWPKIFKADEEDGKFSVTLMIPANDTETITKIKNCISLALEQGYEKNCFKKGSTNLYLPLKDETTKDLARYPEYKNCFYINAKTQQRPKVVDSDKQEILDQSEIYSGVIARASINFYPYGGGKCKSAGVACGLIAIMKVKDGDRISGGSYSDLSEFDDFSEGDCPF